ncbi:MAG: hypothetical protein ACM3TN_11980 [Alphaproteobacteria bacterium]
MKRLIVLAPAITGKTVRWQSLKQRLEAEPTLAGAQWLLWDHHAWPWTLRTPEAFSNDLCARIDTQWRANNGFDEIILVGHSLGGVLIRYAFLLGSGVLDTHPRQEEWCKRVRRFVLFASVNRGFNPNNLHALRFLYLLWRFLPRNRKTLVNTVKAGSDFITDLRIQWIRHFKNLGERAPEVVQLLGTEDGIVTREDSRDVTQFPNAEEIDVPGANHADIYRLEKAEDPESRYCLIRDAFVKPIENRPSTHPPAFRNPVFFILHGIRANNSQWVEQARARIVRRSPNAEVVVSSYGYLPAFDFIIPPWRNRNIEWFKDMYSYYYAMYPNAEFHFLGHSNGTYLLGKSLERVPGMRFGRIVLVGSVLPRNYPWAQIFDRDQVKILRNDRANRDVPVGILCSALRGFGMRALGTAGVDGFDFNDERTSEVFYYDGGHSKALSESNIENLVDYLLSGFGDDKKREELCQNRPAPIFGFCSRTAPLLAYVLLGALGVLIWCLVDSWPSAVVAIAITVLVIVFARTI